MIETVGGQENIKPLSLADFYRLVEAAVVVEQSEIDGRDAALD
jgi:hypothetical protein